VGRFCRWYA